eukprot:6491343-Amphidinium_carterae.2
MEKVLQLPGGICLHWFDCLCPEHSYACAIEELQMAQVLGLLLQYGSVDMIQKWQESGAGRRQNCAQCWQSCNVGVSSKLAVVWSEHNETQPCSTLAVVHCYGQGKTCGQFR